MGEPARVQFDSTLLSEAKYSFDDYQYILMKCPMLRKGGRRVLALRGEDLAVSEVLASLGHSVVSEADYPRTSLAAASFDVIVAWGVLDAFEREAWLREGHRLLKTGGEIFIVEANATHPLHWLDNGAVTADSIRHSGGEQFEWDPPDFISVVRRDQTGLPKVGAAAAGAIFRAVRFLWAAAWTCELVAVTGRKRA
jgi:hypothetical protein